MSISPLPVLALWFVATAAAAAPDSHACAAVADAAARLACYDAAFPPASGAQPAPAAPPVLTPEARKEKAVQEFGLTGHQKREAEPEATREIQPERIEATVTAVSERGTGERVVTLDSGQVWLLTEKTSKGHLIAGHRVTIKKAALGSFMMLTPARIPLRARRIK